MILYTIYGQEILILLLFILLFFYRSTKSQDDSNQICHQGQMAEQGQGQVCGDERLPTRVLLTVIENLQVSASCTPQKLLHFHSIIHITVISRIKAPL